MFIVLSSWHSHCDSSLGSRDEYSTAPCGRQPLDQANWFGPQVRMQLQRHLLLAYYYSARNLILILPCCGG